VVKPEVVTRSDKINFPNRKLRPEMVTGNGHRKWKPEVVTRSDKIKFPNPSSRPEVVTGNGTAGIPEVVNGSGGQEFATLSAP
jgi:hypothetical protein